MATKINLLVKQKKQPMVISIKNRLSSGLLVFFVLLSLASSAVYIYWLSLTKERDSLTRMLTRYEEEIASYSEVEEEKSLITVKVKELQKLIDARFDYLKAIDDVQKLFGYSLAINSIEVDTTGNVKIKADKRDKLQISEKHALDTNITVIELTLHVNSSEELQEAIDSLKVFHGVGLTGATVSNTTRLEEGGYEVDFILNLKPNA